MTGNSNTSFFHIIYWAIVIGSLTLIFGRSWQNNVAAFYFIAMLLPIVLGTSYFFNYFLVPRYFIKQKYFKFSLYTIYTIIISLYLEAIILMIAYVMLGNLSFDNLSPRASDTILLATVMYLLVILGSLILMFYQVKENQNLIQKLLSEQEKLKRPFLVITANRKKTQIAYDEIMYIESLSDYVLIYTSQETIRSKMKISHLAQDLPEHFLRIHRSFIVNSHRILSTTNNSIQLENVQLNIGRSYRNEIKEFFIKNSDGINSPNH